MLARWLDALADLPRGRGAARALAGTRGVGKSHTLAVFCALAGSEKLRGEVKDAHVATSARRLLERRYRVVQVERGTRATLAEEMAAAFTKVFGGSDVQWGSDPAQMLAVAASRANEATLIVCIDTAFNRPARVCRDDGPQLGALKAVTAGLNAFVALALDDDIAGADGVNVALSGTYQIDYVDTEHLYRIVEQYLLRKSPQARDMLHDVYLSLRANVNGFNWSEPRFASLYPVHPLVADVSASVRLYASSFAFLPFAAKASARALGRPVLSLILLDEVFDSVEGELRKSEELREAFEAYDHLASKGLEKVPVMQRLQARLILKSLFVLSLDGRGATASELRAALLMSDETLGGNASEFVCNVLAGFAEVASEGTLYTSTKSDGAETRYRFQIGPAAALDAALDAHVEGLPDDAAQALEHLRAIPRTLFADWPLAAERGGNEEGVNFHLNWRGSERPGHVSWPTLNSGGTQASPAAGASQSASRHTDWGVLMLPPGTLPSEHDAKDEAARDVDEESASVAVRVVWQPAALTPEEALTLRRLHALRTDAAFGSKFGETASAATNTLAAQAERIWTRVYVNDSVLFINGVRESFTHRARAARTLGAVFAETLAPHFDKRYPQHPRFTETLGERDVTQLVEKLFGGVESSEADAQRLCRAFALPLGLATIEGEACAFETSDESLAQPWNREVLALAEGEAGQVVSLERVRRALRGEPYGLLSEAQHLVLAALVAQRRIELVTTSDERISRRTPVRSIKWDEVAGLCRAETARYSVESLTHWARLLTGNDELPAASTTSGRAAVRAALSRWLDSWQRFDLLWREFHARYVEHYAGVHDKTVGVECEREWLATLRRTERWSQFEALSSLPVVSRSLWDRASELLRLESDSRCDFAARQLLETHPACACSFRLALEAELEALPRELEETMERGLEVYRRTLSLLSDHLAIALDALARKDEDAETTQHARTLSKAFAQKNVPEHLTRLDVRLIERALQRMAAPPPVRVATPMGEYGRLTREQLRSRLEQWLDELPEQPVLIEVFAGERDGP
ncbi:MAG: DUF6079 family protein [Acidobacteria bacterium]|nr:DUF6079 family protein [Acidobacteriota bacterium]